MSLLPKALQFRDDALCLPLGPAIPKPVPVKVDPNAWFDAVGRENPKDRPPEFYAWCREQDQIKGAAQATHTAPAIPAKPVAAPPFKPGDLVRYKASSCLAGETREVAKVIQNFTNSVYQTPFTRVDFAEGGFDDATSLELIPSEPQASEGWVAWGGGPPPYHLGRLRVRFTDGVEGDGDEGDPWLEFCWTWRNLPSDELKIVAYRVIK